MVERSANKDIVDLLNELILTSPPQGHSAYIVRNLRKDSAISRTLRDHLDEQTRSDSLSGVESVEVLQETGNLSSLSAIVTFKNGSEAETYIDGLATKDVAVSGSALVLERCLGEASSSKAEDSGTSAKGETLGLRAKSPISDSAETLNSDSSSKAPKSEFSKSQNPELSSTPARSRESTQSPEKPDASTSYDALVVENFSQLIPQPTTLEEVQKVVSKFALFHQIEALFLPVRDENGASFQSSSAAFIGFEQSEHTSEDLLRCFYHLNGLTLDDLLAFSEKDFHDITLDVNRPEKEVREKEPHDKEPRLRLSVCQKKHAQYLAENGPLSFVAMDPAKHSPNIFLAAEHHELHQKTVARFSKQLNYQETNVYVNNLPVLFENDDDKWHRFWSQFGDGIKSAKIIKPQFYSKKSDPSFGKFGFVFYKDVRMAIRAIMLTNKKRVRHGGHPELVVQASFAIQKKSSPMKQHTLKFDPPYSYAHMPEAANGFRTVGPRFSAPALFDGVSPVHAPMIAPPQTIPPIGPFRDNFFVSPYYVPLPGPPMGYGDEEQGGEYGGEFGGTPPAHGRRFSDGPVSPAMNHAHYGFYYYPYPGT